MKLKALLLAVLFAPVSLLAQTYVEDTELVDGSKGPAILCKRNSSGASLTGTDGDASFVGCTATGAILMSSGTGASDIAKAEDSAHTSGDVAVPNWCVRNENAANFSNAEGDYTPNSCTQKGSMFVELSGTFGNAYTGSVAKTEDTAVSSGHGMVMMGAVYQSTPAQSAGTAGDASDIITAPDGGLWVTLTPSTGGGWTPSLKNALSTTVSSVKASAGTLGGIHCYNPAAAATYVQIFNVASGSVVLGTTTPALSIGMPTLGGALHEFANGIAFSTAISVAATTTSTGSSAPATAAECNFWYK